MKPDFMGSTAKIIAEVMVRTCIDDVDIEVLGELLKAELDEHCRMLDEYYIEEYSNAISRARNSAYDAGYDDGYSDGQSSLNGR